MKTQHTLIIIVSCNAVMTIVTNLICFSNLLRSNLMKFSFPSVNHLIDPELVNWTLECQHPKYLVLVLAMVFIFSPQLHICTQCSVNQFVNLTTANLHALVYHWHNTKLLNFSLVQSITSSNQVRNIFILTFLL